MIVEGNERERRPRTSHNEKIIKIRKFILSNVLQSRNLLISCKSHFDPFKIF